MKSTFAITCFTLGVALAPLAAHAVDSDADRSHPGAFVKDSVITTKIKTKLASEHLSSVERIKVDTDKDGVVWLSGVAKTQNEANRAIMIARNTEGVRSVKNDLQVEHP